MGMFKKRIDKEQEKIEKEFNNGNVILLHYSDDYEDFDEFKEKTSEINNIKEKIKKVKIINGK